MKSLKNRKGVIRLHTNGIVEVVSGDGLLESLSAALRECGAAAQVSVQPDGQLSLGGAVDFASEDGMRVVKAFSRLSKEGWEID